MNDDVTIDDINITDTNNDGGGDSTITVNVNGEENSTTVNTPVALFADIINDLEQTDEVSQTGIVLTPSENNGGAFETGVTGSSDNKIVAGRTELLHGAYIDGGGGYNTLEVDMKGFIAQPFQLENIQEVQAHNLENLYNVNQTILDGATANFPIPSDFLNADDEVDDEGALTDSFLDLSRADDLEKLVLTESAADGGMVIAGVKNYATTRLAGDFEQAVNLYYGDGQGSELKLELANVSMSGGPLNLGHNAGALNLVSEGRINVLENADFGDYLREIKVSGEGELVINSDLDFAFGEANIDASENSGGLRLSISTPDNGGEADGDDLVSENGADGSVSDLLEEVTVKGSSARDVIAIGDTDAGAVLNIDTNGGRDTLILNGVDAGRGSVIAGDELTIRIADNAETRLDLADLPEDASFEIDSGATLVVTQAQVDALGIDSFNSVHRDGGDLKVLIQEDTDLSDTDLTELVRELDLTLELDDGVTLEATREQLDQVAGIEARAASNDSTVRVTDLGEFDVEIGDNDLTLTGDQADGRSITDSGARTVTVTDLEDTAGADLSDINANTETAELDVDGDVTFTGDLGDVDLDVTDSDTDAKDTLTFGAGAVIANADIDVTTNPVDVATTAAIASGADLKVTDGDVNITGLEDARDADLSTIVTNNGDLNVALDSSGDVEITDGADLHDATVTISGNGTVDFADETAADNDDGADVSDATFVVGADATIISDQSHGDGDSVVDIQNDVSGEGTMQVTGLNGATITLVDPTDGANINAGVYDGPRFTELDLNDGDAGATVKNFTVGTFDYDTNDLTSGVHKLDFTGFLGENLSYSNTTATDLEGDVTGADEIGENDIISFSGASPDTLDAAGIEEALDGDNTNNAFSGNSAVEFGDNAEKIFLASDDTDAQAFYWEDGIGGTVDGEVQAGELTETVTLNGVDLAGLSNLEDSNFVLA